MSVSAGYTERELQRVWTLPEPQQRHLLPPAMAKLYEKDTSESYLTEWTSMLRDSARFTFEQNTTFTVRNTPRGGHEHFLELCVEAGLVNSILKVADLRTMAANRARINALNVWFWIAKGASRNPVMAGALQEQRNEVIDVLLRSLLSDLFMQKALAVRCIRLFANTALAGALTNAQIANLMFGFLRFAISDYLSIVDNLRNKQFAWQRELMNEPRSHSFGIDQAQAFAPRFWSQVRDDALNAVAMLLCSRDTLTVRRDCLAIITSKPQIIDHLLILIDSDRKPWHPEYVADATAARILMHLLMTPHAWIPELSEIIFSAPYSHFPPGHTTYENDTTAEWKATVSCWEAFVKRTKWLSVLMMKWDRIQAETREDILSKFQEMPKYMGPTYKPSDLDGAFLNRGMCRICIIRILINLTYGETSSRRVVPTETLFCFLPVAYAASQKIPSEARVARSKRHADGAMGSRDAWTRRERETNLVLMSTIQQNQPCLFLSSEAILGPILLFRVLRRVYDTFGDDVVDWKFLPEHSLPNTHLGRIQQIASEETLGIVLRNVVFKRISAEKTSASRWLEGKMGGGPGKLEDYARAVYMAAAELALTAEKFYDSAGPEKVQWEDLIHLAEKELVACLGNASLMSNRLGQWDHAWWYAKHALASLEEVDQATAKRVGWEPSAMLTKNKMRLADAEAKLVNRR